MEIRRLGPDDAFAAAELGSEAFGGPRPRRSGPDQTFDDADGPGRRPGRHAWGVFDGTRLAAKAVAHEYASWWGGVAVPTAGIADVAVAVEHRGAGLLRPLFEAMLDDARGRGDLVSTLFPTAPGIYRSLGYEVVSSYDTVVIPTAELQRVRRPAGMRLRRAEPADLADVAAVHAVWAAAQNGPLTRTGPLFQTSAEDLLAERSITLAVDPAGQLGGFMTWRREHGYDRDAVLRVHDLVATSAHAYRALWHAAGSFATVTGTVRLTTSGADPARLVLPGATWDPVDRHPYALRVLDVVGLLDALGAGPGTAGAGGPDTLDLRVAGDRLGVLDGGYRLGPTGATSHPDADGPTLTPQGLALLVTGAQTCTNLRLLSHLAGPEDHDAALDVRFAGRPLHVRDYF